MVRKITVVVLAVCMCLVLCVSASAASYYYPIPPNDEYSHVYLTYENYNYYLYLCDKPLESYPHSNGSSTTYNIYFKEQYNLVNNEWELADDGSETVNHLFYSHNGRFVYDSSGLFATDSLKDIFGIDVPVSSKDWETVTKQFIGQINVKSVVSVLVVGASAVIGLVFMWWGGRKLVRAVMIALRKGKVHP